MYSENEVIKLLTKMSQEFDSIEGNAEKFAAGNNSAGTRLRKQMQIIKNLAQDVRLEVQKQKNTATVF
tara:strand:+ start:464 stop:667 length:204 start_codon:yes stop_codon:yes gene_type:complete